jgi:lipopolysaccharide/colanic/teichoic acid biosynthesis glycosyltransferase
MYRRYFKRFMDIALSFTGLVILSPLLLIIITISCVKTGKNPFFLQKRPGLNERIFTLIKLRTMNEVLDHEGNPLPDFARMTRWGRFLRETSLDEIPQLCNVLAGDMSLIGPRPLLPEYLPFYSAFHKRRHEVRPGITGWAQINGRNAISWQQKFDLDVWYIDHCSFKLDLYIFIKTVKKIGFRDGVNRSASVTMPWFDGTN